MLIKLGSPSSPGGLFVLGTDQYNEHGDLHPGKLGIKFGRDKADWVNELPDAVPAVSLHSRSKNNINSQVAG